MGSPNPPAVLPDGVWRIIPIGANLLPDEIIEARRLRTVRWVVITSLVLFIALLAAWYLQVTTATDAAEDKVGQAEDRVRVMQRQEREFNEVVNVRRESQTITSQLTALFANDLEWAKLTTEAQAAAPKGILISAVLGSVNAANAAPEAAGRLPSTSKDKTVGAIIVSGTGPDKITIAAYVDALTKVPGLANPQISDVALQDGRLRFSVRLDITAARLGGRYAAPSASGAPSAPAQGVGK